MQNVQVVRDVPQGVDVARPGLDKLLRQVIVGVRFDGDERERAHERVADNQPANADLINQSIDQSINQSIKINIPFIDSKIRKIRIFLFYYLILDDLSEEEGDGLAATVLHFDLQRQMVRLSSVELATFQSPLPFQGHANVRRMHLVWRFLLIAKQMISFH